MIRVAPAPEPADFDKAVRRPGTAARLEMVGDPAAPTRPGTKRKKIADRVEDIPVKRLPTFWREAIPWLRKAHGDVCLPGDEDPPLDWSGDRGPLQAQVATPPPRL